MKIRLIVSLLGLAISFTAPTFAQQKGTVDPQVDQQIRTLAQKYDEAINKHDAADVAELYAQDAVWCNNWKIRRDNKSGTVGTIWGPNRY